MSTNEPSRFSRDFKLEALRRMQAGENVSVLARELGVSRKGIYKWRNRYRLGGSNALRGRETCGRCVARVPGNRVRSHLAFAREDHPQSKISSTMVIRPHRNRALA